MGWDWMEWDGIRWDGMGWDGMDGMGLEIEEQCIVSWEGKEQEMAKMKAQWGLEKEEEGLSQQQH